MPEQLSVITERIKRLSNSLVKKERKAHAEKLVSAEESLNPRMFQLYFENGRVPDMRDLVNSPSGNFRNHVILCILSENCCRLATAMNMTISEFRKGLIYVRIGYHVFRVLTHKTVAKQQK